MEETRPKWDFKTPKEIAEWLRNHAQVDKITHHSWHDGFGVRSEEWMHFHAGKNQSPKIPANIIGCDSNAEVVLKCTCSGLVYLNANLRTRLEEIKKFDAKNKAERATYERLKKKFG